MARRRSHKARLGRTAALGVLIALACYLTVAFGTDPQAQLQRGEGIRFAGKRPAAQPLAHALSNLCGAGAVTSANRPDTSLSSPNLIHVTYAVPSDGADRFASLANAIKTDVDAIGAWWAGQDASRAPRFDLAD